jgi:hypothetical protein
MRPVVTFDKYHQDSQCNQAAEPAVKPFVGHVRLPLRIFFRERSTPQPLPLGKSEPENPIDRPRWYT